MTTKYVTKITSDSLESAHQTRFFEWCALNQRLHPILNSPLLFAVVNENKVKGIGGAITGAKHKAMGKKAGVADILCLWPMPRMDNAGNVQQPKHGLCIEMKKSGGKQSPEQKIFQKQIEEQGYFYTVAYSWHEAAQVLCDYLGLKVSIDKD